MAKRKKGFSVKIEETNKMPRTEYHRPTRSMKMVREELKNEDLWKEAQGYDDEEDDREKFV